MLHDNYQLKQMVMDKQARFQREVEQERLVNECTAKEQPEVIEDFGKVQKKHGLLSWFKPHRTLPD